MKRLNKHKKLLLALAAVFVLLFSLTAAGKEFWANTAQAFSTANRDTVASRYDISCHFLDVGKADAMLLEQGKNFFLIDGGTVNSGDAIISYLTRRGVKELEGVFVTHPDADHLGAIYRVLQDFPVKNFYTVDSPAESQEYLAMQQELKNTQTPVHYLKAGAALQFDQLQLTVFSPGETFSSSNDMSLVIRLQYKDFSALVTGDAGKIAEEAMLNQPEALISDIIKISHHGSNTASSEAFLAAVSPKAAILSVGPDRNNLPDREVLTRLAENNIPAYRTDYDGTIIVSSNGDGTIHISTKEHSYEIIDS